MEQLCVSLQSESLFSDDSADKLGGRHVKAVANESGHADCTMTRSDRAEQRCRGERKVGRRW